MAASAIISIRSCADKRMERGQAPAMEKLKHHKYDKLLEPLQLELARMARWVKASGARIVVLFEGRDTAGKGGAIGAISEVLNPRQCRTVALGKPSEREAGEWYFQRYVEHLPSAGEI